ncbi:MAG: hypothetical protein PF689_05375 [Deltaproteobacteria bacterium]|jgi:nucleoside-triphosphatase THEP1|nr:hypothetical protein [Deltaproteobacteria bacterium]
MMFNIIVTGEPASGKTTLLSNIAKKYEHLQPAGVLSPATSRPLGCGKPAQNYYLKIIGQQKKWDWAKRNKQHQFEFFHENMKQVINRVEKSLHKQPASLLILDEIGLLELHLSVLSSQHKKTDNFFTGIRVLSVKKAFLNKIISKFKLDNNLIIDLDKITLEEAEEKTKKFIGKLENRKIGTYAGFAGITEVGLGSMLHLWKIPLKGHFLASLQNILLIIFGQQTKGKGLFKIAFLTAVLKIFSPMHSPFKPMFYIWAQGSVFAAITVFTGWNLPGVILASIFMSWTVLVFSLLFDYLIFGISFFQAMINGVNSLLTWLNLEQTNIFSLLLTVFLFKAVLAATLSFLSWNGLFNNFIHKMIRHFKKLIPQRPQKKSEKNSLGSSAFSAFKDLFRFRYLSFLLLSFFLIIFLTDITRNAWFILVIRALSISWLSFLIIRRINVVKLVNWLDKKGKFQLDSTLDHAIDSMWENNSVSKHSPGEKINPKKSS